MNPSCGVEDGSDASTSHGMAKIADKAPEAGTQEGTASL